MYHVTLRAFCYVGDLCPSGMDVGLVDGTRCQGYQVLAHTITREGSKCLIGVYKLQKHTPLVGIQLSNGCGVCLAA